MKPSDHTPAHTLPDQIAHLKQQNASMASADASAFSTESPNRRPNGTKSARPVLHLPIHTVCATHSPRQSAALA